MNKSAQILFMILILPNLYESIDHTLPTISYGPFTIGRWALVIVGTFILFTNWKENVKSKIFNGFGILLLGSFLAGLVLDETESLSRTIAFFMFLLGAKGIAIFFNTTIGRKTITVFFAACLVYWSNYIFSFIFSGGQVNAYSSLFIEGEVINHHFVGIVVSVAGLAIGVLFFFRNRNLSIWGYFVIFFAAVICFLSESRSNTMFTIVGIILVLMVQGRNISKQVIILIPVLFIVFFAIDSILQKSDALTQRFDVNDTDYQERTTGMRFEMIEIAINDIISHPLGKGFKNVYIKVGTRDLNIHNQYLSYIIGGGIISFIGTIIWLMGIYSNMKFLTKKESFGLKSDAFLVGITIATTVFHITLFTIEYSSLLFFVILSLGFVTEAEIQKQKNSNILQRETR